MFTYHSKDYESNEKKYSVVAGCRDEIHVFLYQLYQISQWYHYEKHILTYLSISKLLHIYNQHKLYKLHLVIVDYGLDVNIWVLG